MVNKEKLVWKLHTLVSKYQEQFHEINMVANDLNWACTEALAENNEKKPLFTNREAALIDSIQDEAEQREEILDYGNKDVDPDIFFKHITKLESLVQKELKKAAKSKRKS